MITWALPERLTRSISTPRAAPSSSSARYDASSASSVSAAPTEIPGAATVPGLKANKPYRIAVLFPNAGDPYFKLRRYG